MLPGLGSDYFIASAPQTPLRQPAPAITPTPPAPRQPESAYLNNPFWRMATRGGMSPGAPTPGNSTWHRRPGGGYRFYQDPTPASPIALYGGGSYGGYGGGSQPIQSPFQFGQNGIMNSWHQAGWRPFNGYWMPPGFQSPYNSQSVLR